VEFSNRLDGRVRQPLKEGVDVVFRAQFMQRTPVESPLNLRNRHRIDQYCSGVVHRCQRIVDHLIDRRGGRIGVIAEYIAKDTQAGTIEASAVQRVGIRFCTCQFCRARALIEWVETPEYVQ